MFFKNPFRWRKPFITSKEELGALSDAEKGLVAEHRQKMLQIERDKEKDQQMMANEISKMFGTPTPEAEKAEYLYDFLGGWHSTNNQIIPIGNTTIGTANGLQAPVVDDASAPADIIVRSGTEEKVVGQVIAIKPKDVLHELERVPGPNMTIEHIDAKIHILKTKKNLIQTNSYGKHEMMDMVTRLENRKKWDEFKDFYDQFENTTSDKIQDLVNKYKLVLKGSDLFVAAFPDEAVNIMKEYKDQTIKLCGKAPIFYVIAEEKMFKDEYKKKDPILLAQSPFGAYWQILGAWDKEMILLEEL